MAKLSENDILLSVFTGVEGAHAFSAFMPSWFTVRKFGTAPEDADKLRSGYAPAIAFNVILGTAVSLLIDSPAPVIVSAAVIVFMILMYEGAISGEQK